MPRSSNLPDRLNAGSPALAAWCGLPDPTVSAVLAREAFDAVVLDMQHSAIDYSVAVRAIPLIAAAGKPAIVRIPVGEFATASRLLDAGASGVIAPMVNTVADAHLFADFMKYPPLGQRSWGPHGALAVTGLEPGDYFRAANGLTVALAMVETREALAIIDEILAVPGIDGVFIGPGDLSIGLSGGRELNPTSAAVEDGARSRGGAKPRRRQGGGRFRSVGRTGSRPVRPGLPSHLRVERRRHAARRGRRRAQGRAGSGPRSGLTGWEDRPNACRRNSPPCRRVSASMPWDRPAVRCHWHGIPAAAKASRVKWNISTGSTSSRSPWVNRIGGVARACSFRLSGPSAAFEHDEPRIAHDAGKAGLSTQTHMQRHHGALAEAHEGEIRGREPVAGEFRIEKRLE